MIISGLMKPFFYGVVGVLMLFSLLAMFNGITSESLLLDESFFARNLAQFPDGFYNQSAPSAPLFYLLSWLLVRILGNAEWVLRLLPVVSGAASLILISVFLVRRFNLFAALTSVFLLASSAQLIHHSGNAHPYATDVLCAVVLFILTRRVLEEWSLKRWLGWVIAALLSVLLSFTAFFIVPAYGLVILAWDFFKGEHKGFLHKIAGIVPVGLVMAAIAILLWRHAQSRPDLEYWNNFYPGSWNPWVLAKWFHSSTTNVLGYHFWNLKPEIAGFFLILLGSAFLISKKRGMILILCWAPILVAAFAAVLQKWPYGPVRTMLFSLPFFLSLIAAALDGLWDAVKPRTGRIALVLAALLIIYPQAYALRQGFVRIEDGNEAWRTLRERVEPELREGDSFVLYLAAATQFAYYFPDEVQGAAIQSWNDRGNEEALREYVRTQLDSTEGRVWLFFTHVHLDDESIMTSEAEKHGLLIGSHSVPGCSAYLYEKRTDLDKEEHPLDTTGDESRDG